MSELKSTRNVSLDILRIVSCLGVIAIHASGSVFQHEWTQTGTLQWALCEGVDSISRWSVPVFAMLSGYIFLNPNKPLPISKLFFKYILRLIIALVFWSAFYAFSFHVSCYPFGIQEGHFWYVEMCIGLYLALPILRGITVNYYLLSYFCWVWLGCKIYFFIGNFVPLPFDMPYIMFTDYVGYAMWAYYLSLQKRTRSLNILMSLQIISCIFITVLEKVISKNPDSCFGGYNSITTIGTSIGLFYIFCHLTPRFSNKVNKIIQFCAECTFGVYLIHMWLLIQFIFRVHRFIASPIVVVLINIFIVFIVGIFITAIIKKIPILKKCII